LNGVKCDCGARVPAASFLSGVLNKSRVSIAESQLMAEIVFVTVCLSSNALVDDFC
jgi:hypothetical protein